MGWLKSMFFESAPVSNLDPTCEDAPFKRAVSNGFSNGFKWQPAGVPYNLELYLRWLALMTLARLMGMIEFTEFGSFFQILDI